MGCQQGKLVLSRCNTSKFSRENKCFYLSNCQFYNFYQESYLNPELYTVFDLRSQKQFNKETVQGAVFLYDEETIDSKKEKVETTVRRKSRLESFRKSTVGSFLGFNLSDIMKNEAYKNYLYHLVHDRIVLLLYNKPSIRFVRKFVEHMFNNGLEPRMVGLLTEGVQSLRLSYPYLMSDASSHRSPKGPTEILAYHSRFTKTCGLYLSGYVLVKEQFETIQHLNISVIINLSSTPREINLCKIPKCFTFFHETSNMLTIVECLLEQLKKYERVLILDEGYGNEFGVEVCACFLMYIGVSQDRAIAYIKQCKPSADMNYLMSAYGFSTTTNRLTNLMEKIHTILEHCNLIPQSILALSSVPSKHSSSSLLCKK